MKPKAKIKSKLVSYARKSPIMNIKIQYKKEIIEFNLDEEMRVDESYVTTHLKSHIRNNAFLQILQVKLQILYKSEQKKLQRAVDQNLIQYKIKFKTITEATAQMYIDIPSLKAQEDALLELEEFRDTVYACVRSYEARQNLLQSISANVRKES